MNNNLLEFYVRIKDLMSSGLAKLAQNAKKEFAKVDNYIDSTVHKTNKLTDAFHKVTEKIKSSGHSIGKWAKDIAIGLGITAASVLPAVTAFAKTSLSSAIANEYRSGKIAALSGNQAGGRQLGFQLNNLAGNAGLNRDALFEGSQALLSSGGKVGAVIPLLKEFGDVSVGDAGKLKTLAETFSKVQESGALTSRTLTAFVNAGLNPLAEISRTTGESMESLEKKMKGGQITTLMVANAFKTATSQGGQFHNMMLDLEDTVTGRTEKLKNRLENIKISAGQALMPLADGFLNVAENALKVVSVQQTLPDILRTEKANLDSLVGTIVNLNTTNAQRTNLLETLKRKYPDMFGNIDVEKIKNNELLTKLQDVNAAYEKRIMLATNAGAADALAAAAGDLNSQFQKYSTAAELARQGQGALAVKSLGFWERQNISEKDANNPAYYQAKADKIQRQLEAANAAADRAKKKSDYGQLLSDAQDALKNGTFKGITKDAFSALITKTMGKGLIGMASEAEYSKLRSYFSAGDVKGGGGKVTPGN